MENKLLNKGTYLWKIFYNNFIKSGILKIKIDLKIYIINFQISFFYKIIIHFYLILIHLYLLFKLKVIIL